MTDLLDMIMDPSLTPKLTGERWWAYGGRFTYHRYEPRHPKAHIAYYLDGLTHSGRTINEFGMEGIKRVQRGSLDHDSLFGFHPGLYTDTLVRISHRTTCLGIATLRIAPIVLCGMVATDSGITPEYPGFLTLVQSGRFMPVDLMNMEATSSRPGLERPLTVCGRCLKTYWAVREPSSLSRREDILNRLHFKLLKSA